ncbi:MAG: hypothetical protein COB02_18090 [Candidatus Cloacimonadota bacterium]|nr:MAG: hypothetical protein COB02_18090 [Candidatus Cloacimonadota bacterium]
MFKNIIILMMCLIYTVDCNVLTLYMAKVPVDVFITKTNSYYASSLAQILMPSSDYSKLLKYCSYDKKSYIVNKNQLFFTANLIQKISNIKVQANFTNMTIKVNGPVKQYFEGIKVKATSFEPQIIASKGKRKDFTMNDWDMGIALPSRKYLGKKVLIYYAKTNKSVVANVIDVGPWNTKDDYINKGTRPAAESGIDERGRKTNGAGIDLSYPVWVELGIDFKKAYSGKLSSEVQFMVLN